MALNKPYVLFHLQEAKEELDRTIQDLRTDPDYDIGEYRVVMEHLFHHINTAWNARSVSDERAAECSDEDFRAWRQFPSDMEV